MSHNAQRPIVRRFGVFEADVQAGELRRNGNRVPLQEKPFQLLSALLERPGEVISRDELAERLWSDVNVDAERGIGEAVFRLRQALGDDAHTPRYIETVPKRGYRLIAAVDAVGEPPPEPEPTPALPPPQPPKPWLTYAALALGSAVLGAVGASLIDGGKTVSPTPPRRWSYSVEQLTVDDLTQPILAISPDGKKLVFGANRALWLQELDELWNPQRLPGSQSEGIVFPAWSPDSRKLAFVKDGELWRLDIPGGAPKLLAKDTRVQWPLWNPNGRSMLFLDRLNFGDPQVWEVALEGGEPRPAEWLAGAPRFLTLFSHGSGFGMLGEIGSTYRTTVVVLARPGVEPRELSLGRLPRYAASGHVVFQRHGVRAIPFSAHKAEPTGEPFVVAQGGKSPSVSGDGTLVYAEIPEDYDQLLLLDQKGKPVRHIGERQPWIAYPDFSPDHKRVAVWAFEEATDDDWMVDIWIHEVDRPTKSRLTIHPRTDLFPRWTPDGRSVSFSSDRGEHHRDLYLRAVDSSRPAELLWGDELSMYLTDWSGDGRRALVWAHSREAQQDLWLLDRDENEIKPLLATPFQEGVAAFSPDERYIAFPSDRSGEREVWVCPIDNCGDNLQRISTRGGYQVRWAKEEGALYYVEDNRKMVRVEIQTQPELVIGEPETLFESPHLWLPGSVLPFFYDVTEDGEQFVVVDSARARTTKESPGVIHVWQNWAAAFPEQDE